MNDTPRSGSTTLTETLSHPCVTVSLFRTWNTKGKFFWTFLLKATDTCALVPVPPCFQYQKRNNERPTEGLRKPLPHRIQCSPIQWQICKQWTIKMLPHNSLKPVCERSMWKITGICIQPNPRAAGGREIRLQKISKSARFSTDPHCKIVQISSSWPGRNPPPPTPNPHPATVSTVK